MNKKLTIRAALSALTAAAMSRCATTDLPALLELHNAAVNAINALPDAGPLTSAGSSGAIIGSSAKFLIGTPVTDENQPLILIELRKHTALLTALCRHQRGAELIVQAPLDVAAPGAKKSSNADRGTASASDVLAPFSDFAAAVTAAAEKRFAADPFAPTFELFAGEDAVTVKLYPRPGSVQYIVNVTGPRSSAVRIEGGTPKLVQVSRVEEAPSDATPPPGAKPGYWLSVVGMKQPAWIESPPQTRTSERASPVG
ncbi:hypothetical protein [Janthinobacterium sp. UMAB-56]|uniref:hypothetical protein n=1 Tax=Janthinobacterium sp. UMAB-56 TaxID=1365361 RepID=UPI001C5A4A3C|nr:hypothetical protein [Janthinobacterium sp. UMAB-56]